LARNFIVPTGHLAELEADMGIHRPGQGSPPHRRLAERAVSSLPAESPIRTLILAQATAFDAAIPLAAEDYARALEIVRPVIQRAEAAAPPGAGGIRFRHILLAACYRTEALAAYQLGQYAAAEKAARMGAEHWKGLDARIRWEKFDAAELRIFQGMAIARQGRLEEARKLVEPELQVLRGLVKPGIDDRGVQFLFTHALLASAMVAPGPAQARPLLDEANAVLSRLPPEMSRLKSVARLRGWMNVEMAKRS
jgi:hypothetical protein